MTSPLVIRGASRGVSCRYVLSLSGCWLALAAYLAMGLPLFYPYQIHEGVVDSGVVVGLVLPICVASRLLEEAAPFLARTASRSLSSDRSLWSLVFVGSTAFAAMLVALGTPVPFELFVADAMLLSALAVLGSGFVGGSATWVAPFVFAITLTIPGLVPLKWNLLYNQQAAASTFLVAAIALGPALAVYTRRGSNGWVRSLRVGNAP